MRSVSKIGKAFCSILVSTPSRSVRRVTKNRREKRHRRQPEKAYEPEGSIKSGRVRLPAIEFLSPWLTL
jgi:hypothetical protein